MSAPGPEEAQPQPVLQALPARQGLLAQQSGLWGAVLAAAVVCTGLLVAEAPVWQSAPQAGAAAGEISTALLETDRNCNGKGPLRSPLFPPVPVTAVVLSQMSQDEGLSLIPRSEVLANGVIDPAYIHNPRVLVHVVGDVQNRTIRVLVPDGMAVAPGQVVRFVGGHASPNLACAYVPNLIVGP